MLAESTRHHSASRDPSVTGLKMSGERSGHPGGPLCPTQRPYLAGVSHADVLSAASTAPAKVPSSSRDAAIRSRRGQPRVQIYSFVFRLVSVALPRPLVFLNELEWIEKERVSRICCLGTNKALSRLLLFTLCV